MGSSRMASNLPSMAISLNMRSSSSLKRRLMSRPGDR
jgi:hypothetical protein